MLTDTLNKLADFEWSIEDLSNNLPFQIILLSEIITTSSPSPSSQPTNTSPPLISSQILRIPLPLFQRPSDTWWSAHIERLWFPSSFPFISPVWSVSVINAGPGSTRSERHTCSGREREEGLQRDGGVAHRLPAAVNTQVRVGEVEEVCHMWFITLFH